MGLGLDEDKVEGLVGHLDLDQAPLECDDTEAVLEPRISVRGEHPGIKT